MDSVQRELIAEIAEQPKSDSLRHLYADYCEDHGDNSRSEFIRLQCARARLSPSDRAWYLMKLRETELLTLNGIRWNREIVELGVSQCTYERGFVASVEMPQSAFIQQHHLMFNLAPIQTVRLTDVNDDLASLFASSPPVFRRLTGWDFTSAVLNPKLLDSLLNCDSLMNLGCLNLTGTGIDQGALTRLFASNLFPALDELILAGNLLDECDWGEVNADWSSSTLSSLSLQATYPDLNSLSDFQLLPKLSTLDLSNNESAFEDDGLRLIGQRLNLAALRVLSLRNNCLSSSALSLLAELGVLKAIVSLDLAENRLDEATDSSFVRELASNPVARSLDLSGTYLGDTGLALIANAPGVFSLASLKFAYAQLSDQSAERLAQSACFPSLLDLDLSYNSLTTVGAGLLLAPSSRLRLAQLALNGNHLDSEQIEKQAGEIILQLT